MKILLRHCLNKRRAIYLCTIEPLASVFRARSLRSGPFVRNTETCCTVAYRKWDNCNRSAIHCATVECDAERQCAVSSLATMSWAVRNCTECMECYRKTFSIYFNYFANVNFYIPFVGYVSFDSTNAILVSSVRFVELFL